MVRPGDWGGTAISIDNQGTIHVSWGGVVTGGNYEDVFYSKKENGRWLDPVRINMPDNYADFPQCIISKEPENIWIGWGKQAPISESYAYVSHFDGLSWSPEERLGDMGISYWNGIPELVFISDEVWAVWHGYTVGIDYMDIYYSRYLSSSVSEEQSMELSITNVLAYPNPFGYSISFSYKKTSPGLTSLMIYNLNGSLIRVLTNRYLEGGYSKITWDGKDMKGKETPKGVYFAILKIVESKTVKKIIKWRTK